MYFFEIIELLEEARCSNDINRRLEIFNSLDVDSANWNGEVYDFKFLEVPQRWEVRPIYKFELDEDGEIFQSFVVDCEVKSFHI